jgi:putative transposase
MKPVKGSKNLRSGRSSIDGQYYFLTTRTRERQRLFYEPTASKIVLDSLRWFESVAIIELEAAVVMPDHLHFVAKLVSGDLPSLMGRLKRFTSRQVNECLNRSGPLWQSQYHDHAIRRDEDLMEVILYCLYNPVRAKLVEDFHEYPHWYCKYQV